MANETAVILEHLEYLSKRHGAATVARSIGVSGTALSLVRGGKRPPSTDLVERLLKVYPLPEVAPAAKRLGESKQNEQTVWINTQTAYCTDTCREAENRREERDELERLTSHEQYQAMRRRVLAVCTMPELRDVLLPAPESGPTVAMGDALTRLQSVILESKMRQEAIDPTVSSGLYRQYSQFREALTRKLEKLEKADAPEDLVKEMPWRATLSSMCGMLQPLPDERVRVITELRGDECNVFSVSLMNALEGVRSITFPCTQFQNDPVGFVTTILGDEPWEVDGEDDQVTFLLAVRDNRLVLAPSARGVGKTKAVAWIVLWRFCCWTYGRVCITNFTGNQLRTQDWAEIQRCINRSGICLDCRKVGVTQRPCPHSQIIDCKVSENPVKGIWSDDSERFIVGVTGKDAQSLGGYHGEQMIVVCDEFSGTKQEMFDVWNRNIVRPEGRFIGPGNPLDGQGSPMHDMCTDEHLRKIMGAKVVTLSAEVAARAGKSYLPTRQDNEMLEQSDPRGKENPEYLISVLGKYPTRDEMAVFAAGEIIKAHDVEIYAATEATGRLLIGIDPSGETEAAHDMAVICVMRGLKVLEWRSSYRWRMDDYLHECLDAWKVHRISTDEFPLIAVDADGVGARVANRLENYQESTRIHEHERCRFELWRVFFGHEAVNWREYEHTGDEGRELVSRWLHSGGVFPYNARLVQEMQHCHWHYMKTRRRDQFLEEIKSATRKDGSPDCFRKVLGRSPDTLDALTVAIMAAHNAELGIVPDSRSTLEIEDEESVSAPPVNNRDAFRRYMSDAKKGRFH